jgi:hypothetical protein
MEKNRREKVENYLGFYICDIFITSNESLQNQIRR